MARVYIRNGKRGPQVWWEICTREDPRRRFPTGVFLSEKKREQREVMLRELELCKKFESIVGERDPMSFSTEEDVQRLTPARDEDAETMASFVKRKLKLKNGPVLTSAYGKLAAFLKTHRANCLTVDDFSTEYACKFVEWSLKGLKQSTVKGYACALFVAFDDCMKEGEVAFNPFAFSRSQQKRLYSKPEPQTDLDVFTKEQLKVLWNSDDEEIANLTRVTFLCYGKRVNEIVNLKWTNIDLDERLITFPTTKTGLVLKVYIGDMLMEILKGMRTDSPYLFNGVRYSAMFSKHLREIGMVKKSDKKNTHAPLSHHAIRRTVETLFTDKFGHDRAEMLVGHVGRTTGMRHYYKAQLALYKEATEFLENYIKD